MLCRGDVLETGLIAKFSTPCLGGRGGISNGLDSDGEASEDCSALRLTAKAVRAFAIDSLLLCGRPGSGAIGCEGRGGNSGTAIDERAGNGGGNTPPSCSIEEPNAGPKSG